MKAIMGGKTWGLASFLVLLPLILPPGLLVCVVTCAAMPGETPGVTEVAPSCHDSMPSGSRASSRFFSSGSHECCLTGAAAPVALSGPGLSNSRPQSNCSPDLSALFDEDLKITPHSHSSGSARDGTPCILCPGIAFLRI